MITTSNWLCCQANPKIISKPGEECGGNVSDGPLVPDSKPFLTASRFRRRTLKYTLTTRLYWEGDFAGVDATLLKVILFLDVL